MGRRAQAVHGATRCYYRIRNSFQLFRNLDIAFISALEQLAAALFNRAACFYLSEIGVPT